MAAPAHPDVSRRHVGAGRSFEMSKRVCLVLVLVLGCGSEEATPHAHDHVQAVSDGGAATGTPAGVRIVLTSSGATAYIVSDVVPAEKREAIVADGDRNQTLRFTI